MARLRVLLHSLAYIVLTGLLLLLVACSPRDDDISGQDETLDQLRPSVIDDLTVIEMTPSTVRVRWTSAGDDGDSGVAATYDLRWLRHTITADNWDSATSVTGLPTPDSTGTIDSVTVTGLLEDSTYFFAIKSVDEAGNWSNLSNVVWAVCFDDYAVTIADSAFEDIIRFYVQKPDGDILRSDMLTFGTLNVSNHHISNLSGIEHCRNLTWLQLWNNTVTDLSPLAGLSNLRTLKAGNNLVTDVSPLAALVNLDTLHLNSNDIVDIAALSDMDSLVELNLTSNQIWQIAPLTGKTTIRNLYLVDNEIVFVNALYDLTGLEKLDLSVNQIDDLLPLGYNYGLGTGDTVWLTNNPLSATTTDSLINTLTARGVAVIR